MRSSECGVFSFRTPHSVLRINMSLIIDGYNLMHAAGLLGRRHGPGVLEKARLALLNVLAESLEPADVPRTTVVFDAKHSPHGAESTLVHHGLTVRFAAEHEEADELIEELIRTDSALRRLTVVSSDHRVQTAARRRRATAIASEEWFDSLLRARRQRKQAPAPTDAKRRAAGTRGGVLAARVRGERLKSDAFEGALETASAARCEAAWMIPC